jgi:hypothetical protein
LSLWELKLKRLQTVIVQDVAMGVALLLFPAAAADYACYTWLVETITSLLSFLVFSLVLFLSSFSRGTLPAYQ